MSSPKSPPVPSSSTPSTADLDRRYLWHPFTQMADWECEEPLVIVRGKGAFLYDADGTAYLDGSSSIWVNLHGHRKGAIDRAIRAQLGRVAHSSFLGLTNPPAAELARRLIELAPGGLERVFYSDNGSTAVEIALKMAYQYWRQRRTDPRPQKSHFMHFRHAYHGDTVGAVSVGGIELFHETFRGLMFPTTQVEFPYCYRCPWGKTYPSCSLHCVGDVEAALKTHAATTAGFVVEPLVQGASGILCMPPGYLSAVADLCRRHDVLLIADEVATGFGRTGRMFACEHESVQPDLLCLSKGITGGYMPLAATLATGNIYDAFLGRYDEFRTFFHGHSYTGNPLACAAALANLDVFRNEAVLERLPPRIDHLWAQLRHHLGEHPAVGEIRGRGLMVGIELVRDRATREPFPLAAQVGNRIGRALRSQGILLRPIGNVVVLMPPLSITRPQLTRLVRGVRQAVDQICTDS
ncbi:MAG: adenosylmethionine--8-amino-7-oxononanoate transaminase [Nitrospirota bacterium]|nr:adenosylmethionine--8-amino-7-oxononanoate transaminase [Nitrospirota bacterium]